MNFELDGLFGQYTYLYVFVLGNIFHGTKGLRLRACQCKHCGLAPSTYVEPELDKWPG